MSPHTSRVSNSPRSLHLFARDLRLGDNAGLAEAARFGDVVAAHVIEREILARASRNPRRAAFYCGAVSSLAADLAARDRALVVRHDGSSEAIVRLADEVGATTVTWAHAYDAATLARQRARRDALEARGLRVAIVHDAPAIAPQATAEIRSESGSGDGYRALAPYVTAWSSVRRDAIAGSVAFARADVASDALPSSVGYANGAEVPNERAALAALDAFLAGPVLQYPSACDVPAGPPTARLSAALSFGVVSARTILARVDERARDPFLLTEERVALATFTRALARRDFFLQLAWFYEDAPDRALQSRMDGFARATEHPALAAWCSGETGYPLVDAGIRQLRATGWMHPRARTVAASFLCFDLGLDWRIGRDAWDDELVEDDPALANGNWQWVAGVGADLAQFPRIYNPRRQARAYDPLGAYVRSFVPELTEMAEFDASRGATGARVQLRLELFGERGYPAPILDHDEAARAYLARYAAFVNASGIAPSTR